MAYPYDEGWLFYAADIVEERSPENAQFLRDAGSRIRKEKQRVFGLRNSREKSALEAVLCGSVSSPEQLIVAAQVFERGGLWPEAARLYSILSISRQVPIEEVLKAGRSRDKYRHLAASRYD